MITNKIPAGWRKLDREEKIIKGDKYWAGSWHPSINWSSDRNGEQSGRYTYIRKNDGTDNFNIGDEVIVGGQSGTIHSPRFYLIIGYGYVVKFKQAYPYTNWNFEGISCDDNPLISFRECLIKPAPKAKEVKLNGTYTATVSVSVNEVKVGCQTFPYEVIKEIVNAHDSLTK